MTQTAATICLLASVRGTQGKSQLAVNFCKPPCFEMVYYTADTEIVSVSLFAFAVLDSVY